MVIKLEFVDFVVSDNPTAYPDGGEQGGYWYEKVVENQFQIDTGTVTLANSSDNIGFTHAINNELLSFVIYMEPYSNTSYQTYCAFYPGVFDNNGKKMVSLGSQNTRAAYSPDFTTNTVKIGSSTYQWYKGTYRWIAIAES